MELALNLAWLMLAVSMAVLWLRLAPEGWRDRRAQFVALALVLLILLPAVSVTDDLVAARFPPELTKKAFRRGQDWEHHHVVLPVLAAWAIAMFRGLSLGPRRAVATANRQIFVLRVPALSSIENRPPPAA